MPIFNSVAPLVDFFGNGVDGDVTVSTSISLARDMFYDNLTITAAGTINCAGFRIFVKNTLNNAGTIHRNGNDAVGATLGAALANLTLGAAGAGGAGTTGAGATPTAITNAFGGNGGSGGLGSNGAGASGTTASAAAWITPPKHALFALIGASIRAGATPEGYNGGAGGGSGGGDGVGSGGGGGGGAGVVSICARTFINSGIVSANGGVGGNGGGTNCGGGGGGGGGMITIVCSVYSNTGTISVAAGAGGSKTGTGVAGSTASAGNIYTHIGL